MQPDVTSSNDVVRIAAHAVLSTRTVRRYLQGESVNDNSKTRIRQALKALGFKDIQTTEVPNES